MILYTLFIFVFLAAIFVLPFVALYWTVSEFLARR